MNEENKILRDKAIELIDLEVEYREKFNTKQSANFLKWLNKYLKFLKSERTFNPNYLPVYEQGSIIKLDLGFNVGSEHGGVHFGVVLNKDDSKRNNVLTILPLSSKKSDSSKGNKYKIDLGNEFYNLVELKFNNIIQQYELDLKDIDKDLESANSKESFKLLRQKLNKTSKRLEEAKRVKLSLDYLKIGTFGLVSQITTVSKIRISDPIKIDSSLYGIKYCNNTMQKINNKILKHIC